MVCCLSSNYENDSKRQGELEYAFKSQYHIVPVRIQSDFKPQQVWLQRILESIVVSVIDCFESTVPLSDAHDQLLLELSKYSNDDGAATKFASKYLDIYRECCNQGWIAVPKLLLHIPVNLLQTAIEKGSLVDITKMTDLMRTLNNQFQEQAQSQIDLFHKWLTAVVQAKENKENQDSNEQQELLQKFRDYCTQNKSEKLNDKQTLQRKVKEVMMKVMQSWHFACEHNDMRQGSNIFKSMTIKDFDRVEKSQKGTAFTVVSSHDHHQIVQILLKHWDSIMKGNLDSQTPCSQAKDGYTQQKCAQFREITPRFAGDSLDWTVAYQEPAIKRAQIRQYLKRAHFLNNCFATVFRRYVHCYLALEGFSSKEIEQLEAMSYTVVGGFICAYTSPMRFYKIINRHLATYALAYFNSSFDTNVPYSFAHCLLAIIAIILNEIRFGTSFTGPVYRGMLMTRKDLYKYVVGSQVLNTAFLSTTQNRLLAERFGGIDDDRTSSAHDPSQMRIFCVYKIRNLTTAYEIHRLADVYGEDEVLIFPFSAFRVTRVEQKSSNIVEIDLVECDEEHWRENDNGEEYIYSPF